ncbi:caldesmon 1a isoform X5 [Channa argus]|uniref:caldesmon 1a isoform X5 n=2 Tax=Channa argus TaxID=215402 RepID=UPI0035211BDF
MSYREGLGRGRFAFITECSGGPTADWLPLLSLTRFKSYLVSVRSTDININMSVFDNVIPQGTIMEEMDFERRRELRRQKREEMRLEAERVTETVSVTSSYGGGGDDEDQALLERMAKREERRQRRMKEALERQRELDPTVIEGNNSFATEKNNEDEEKPSSWRRGRYRENEEEEEKTSTYSSRRKEKEQRQEEEAAPEGRDKAEEHVEEEQEQKVELVEDIPRRSYLREQVCVEEETHSVVSESSNQAKSTNSEAEEYEVASEEPEEVPEDDNVDSSSENKPMLLTNDTEEDNEVSEILHTEDNEVSERGGTREEMEEQGKQNGGLHEESPPKQHRKPERTHSRGSVRSPEVGGDDQDDAARLEAERKLEELKRRRDDAESEEFERMRQKQQEAEAELEELKRKREERRKVLEEEERQKKQEEAEKKAREEEEKRKMKEEIERRRAEAAEKRQKVEDTMDGEGKPFKCVSPRGSSLKIGERAEFLNKSAQKSSSVKMSHSPMVSKIDNRLEQYTSAAQRENKECRSPRSGAVDLPVVTDSIRNIKSMWEKGNVFSSPGGGGSAFKEAAVIKTGVAGRINDWLNKTPESGKASGARPADLKPVDVTNKRSLWENKGASPTKVAGRGETKSVANGMGH